MSFQLGDAHKFLSYRPWDPHNDLRQMEAEFKIETLSRHRTPPVRSGSIQPIVPGLQTAKDIQRRKPQHPVQNNGDNLSTWSEEEQQNLHLTTSWKILEEFCMGESL